MDALEHSSTTVYLFVSEVLSPPGIFSLVVRGQRLMQGRYDVCIGCAGNARASIVGGNT